MEIKRTPPIDDAADAAEMLSALGAPVRLSILRALVRAGQEGMPVGALQTRLAMPASTLSHHLRALLHAGVIAQERIGRSLICRARYDRIEGLAAFLLTECCADATATGDQSENTVVTDPAAII